MSLDYKSKDQKDPYSSPWSIKEAFLIRLWNVVWNLFFRYSPKKIGRYWRVFLLNVFGARVDKTAFIYSSAKIYVPWNLSVGKKSCLGPNSIMYNLGALEIKDYVTISQDVYICNGTHDMTDARSPLMVGEIVIENYVFIGAQAFIMPDIKIQEYAVIGACAVVTKDVLAYNIVAGNPAKLIKKRVIND